MIDFLLKMHCFSIIRAVLVRCHHFGLVSAVRYSLLGAKLAQHFRFLENLLSRIWSPLSKYCTKNQNNLTNQLPGQKNSPSYINKWIKILTTFPAPHSEMPFTSGEKQILVLPFSSRRGFFCPKIDVSIK